jgi:hypothetical protein
MNGLLFCGVALAAVAFASSAARAQDKPAKNPPPKNKPAASEKPAPKPEAVRSGASGSVKRPLAKMTKAREAAALAFVHEHHAELEQLLNHLRENQPQQYDAAIRDLFRTSERLAGYQENDAQRYELELKAWTLNSRIQLLGANLLMSPQDQELRAKVKDAIREQLAVRGELLALERQRTATRLQSLDSQIEKLKTSADKMAERQLQSLLEGNKKREVKTTAP